jgi:hypothetical protein
MNYAPRVLTDPFIKALKPAPKGQRYAAFEFLRDAKEIAPHLFNFKAFSDCLLAD